MTNGEKIKEIFPKLEWVFNAESEYYKTHIDGIHKHCFDSDWWHSEYKESTTKNNLGVDAVSRQAVLDKKELVELEDGQSFYCISPEDVETLPSVTLQEPREAADYENEIADLYNRLDIAEYDKERLREEVTNLEAKIKALEQEPTTKNYLAQDRYQDLIEYFGDEKVAKTILESRKEFKAWLERLRWNTKKVGELARELEQLKSTTKNDSPKYCDRNICLKNEYNNVGCEDCEVTKSQEPTTKNDLGVDAISRADAIRVASGYCHPSNIAKELAKLPSVTPQEPCDKCEVGNPCLYCKHEFEPQESEDKE